MSICHPSSIPQCKNTHLPDRVFRTEAGGEGPGHIVSPRAQLVSFIAGWRSDRYVFFSHRANIFFNNALSQNRVRRKKFGLLTATGFQTDLLVVMVYK